MRDRVRSFLAVIILRRFPKRQPHGWAMAWYLWVKCLTTFFIIVLHITRCILWLDMYYIIWYNMILYTACNRKVYVEHRPDLGLHIRHGITYHDDVIKWKHFPRYWPFVLGIHRSTVNSPHKGQWRGALMFSLVYPWLNAIARLVIRDAIALIMTS